MVSEVNRQKRLLFAKTNANTDWSKVIFTDEKVWRRFGNPGGYVYRPVNQRYGPKYTRKTTQGGGGSVMIWGAISKTKVLQLQVVEGSLNGFAYKKVLSKFLKDDSLAHL